MKSEMQHLLRRVKSQLSPDKQRAFTEGIRSRLSELEEITEINPATVAKHTIFGMAIGAVMDVIPGLETIFGVDGFVDVGAALGSFVGLAKSEEERRKRQAIRSIVIEELNHLVPQP